ncbi:ABC transporter substrate-binding protein [Lagierella sp.]|uniref:ABC transporter substrate-binding protein n=1 Tax=Lagierella sp. TaxID=2849657 RepID=UPI00261DC4B4|nr:ABC transporter substrate-binding protein [Lagierella sp.]
MKKKILAIILIMAFLITGCKAKGGKTNGSEVTEGKSSGEEKIFTLTLFQNPKTLDIQKTNADYFIPIQIYNRLVETEVGESGEPEIVPSLAKSWEVSEDGLVYTFHLNKGVKFHNGEELKADDVLFTIEKMMDPKEATVNSSVFEAIKGSKEKLEGKAEKVEGVKVVDDYTVELTLEKPSGPFLAGLSGAPASIFNRKAVEEGKDKFGFDPEYTVGTGYMKFKDWTQDKEINLIRNDDYFKEPAKVDGVKYLMNIDKATERMMFENGEIDYLSLDKASYEKYNSDDKYKEYITEYSGPSMDYMVFNQKDPNMAKLEVRQAISKAIDRETFNKTFYDGEGILINGVVPPGMPGYQKNLPEIEYNPNEAKELIEKANIDKSSPFIILQNGDSEYTHPMNEMLQKMLKEVGIEAEIKNMDMTSYWDTVFSGEGFSMTIGPVTADVADPDDFYASFTVEDSGANGYNVTDEELSKKINEARDITDTDERIKALNELDKEIVHEKALYFPIASKVRRYITSSRVKNLNLSWQGWVAGATYGVEIEE